MQRTRASVRCRRSLVGHTASFILACLLIACGGFLHAATPLVLDLPHNNRPAQVGMSGVADYSPDYPFVDLWFKARTWVFQKKGAAWASGTSAGYVFQASGYPASMPGGDQYLESTVVSSIPSNGMPFGTYVLTHAGKGELSFQGTPVTGGRLQITISATSAGSKLSLQLFSTDVTDPVRDIHIVPLALEHTWRENFLTPEWREDFKRFKVLRFMDWFHTNHVVSEIETLFDGRVLDPTKWRSWDLRPATTSAFQWGPLGAAYEHAADLCSALLVDCWVCVPHNADDEYVRRMAELFRDRLDPRVRVWVEYSNETWNPGGPFTGQNQWCKNRAIETIGATASVHHYHSKRSLEIWHQWEQTFGNDRRLVRVMAGQTGNPWTFGQRLDTAVPVSYASGLVLPRNRTDCVAGTNYFGGDFSPRAITARTFDGGTAAGWLNAATADIANPKWGDTFGGSGTGTGLLDYAKGLPIVAYEGGLSWEMNVSARLAAIRGLSTTDVDATTINTWTEAMLDAAADAQQYAIHTAYCNAWMNIDPSVIMFSQFTSAGPWSKFGCWGVMNDFKPLSDPTRNATRHRLRALNDWLATHPVANQPAVPRILSTTLTTGVGIPLALSATCADDGARQLGRLHYAWMQASGPGSLVFSNQFDLQSTVVASLPGTYTVRLYANDGWVISYAETTMTVSPIAAWMRVERMGTVIANGDSDLITGASIGTGMPVTYAIVNRGTAPLTLVNAPPVRIQSVINCSASITAQPSTPLAAGAGSSVSLSITPTAAGPWSVTLSAASNDALAMPYVWTAQGTVVGSTSITGMALQLSGPLPPGATGALIDDGRGQRPALIRDEPGRRSWSATVASSATRALLHIVASDGSTKTRVFDLTVR